MSLPTIHVVGAAKKPLAHCRLRWAKAGIERMLPNEEE